MALKLLVRYIINKYLKDYIERLDDEKLKVDLRHGNVSLENLHLKPEALAGYGFPVTVAAGFIEKLSITIPWRNLHSTPTKVHIEGLYILVVPKNEVPQDLTKYHNDKMKRVQRKVDNLRKAALDEHKVEEKDKSYFEQMKTQMMQNLEFTLRNFHISYETKSTTKLGHPFSFGITVHFLQLLTSTNPQRIGRIKENTFVIFKLNQVNSLSIYWNTDCRSRIDMPVEHIIEDLKFKIATDTHVPHSDEMNYIFHPVNLIFELVMKMKPSEQNFERPTFRVDYQIQRMAFDIDPKQLSDLLDFIKFQNYSVFYDRCREYRQLYSEDSLRITKLTEEQKHRIHILETKLDVFTLAYIRHSIELETKGNATSSETDTNNDGWWDWWWQGKPKTSEEDQEVTRTNTASEEDFFSEDLLDIDVEVIMDKIEFNLLSPRVRNHLTGKVGNSNITISRINIDNSRIDYKRRAISSSILLTMDLGYLQIFGLKSTELHRPLIVTSMSKSLNPLIRIEFELAPIDKKSDYRFLLNMEPLTIIYHANTINAIVANFEPVDYSTATQFVIKQRTFKEMEYDLTCQRIFDMTLGIKGLSFLLPEYGLYTNNCKTMLVRFGNLILTSCLNDNNKEDRKVFFKKNDRTRQFYNKYKFIINNLEIIYSPSNTELLNILRRVPSLDMTFYKCIYSDDADLIDWRVAVKIARTTELELSKTIFKKLSIHHELVPSFYSTMSETLHRINFYFTIFPPHTSVEADISIDKCSLIVTHPKKSIETNFYSHILKTRDGDEDNKSLTTVLKNLTMIMHSSVMHTQPFCPFYHNQQIALSYSDTDTKL